jgi:AAA family ATP:ADP antiporter
MVIIRIEGDGDSTKEGGGDDVQSTVDSSTSSAAPTSDKIPTTSTTMSPRPKVKPFKPSIFQSMNLLKSNPYLFHITTLVISYNLCLNLTEILFKSALKKVYTDPLSYQYFMGNFSSAVGLTTFIVILLGQRGEMGGWIRSFGWGRSAAITPGVMAVLALPFFGVLFIGSSSSLTTTSSLSSSSSLSILHYAVFFGTIQALLSKSMKYAFFDPTLQMVYLPLTPSEKTSGKAAIDVLGSRLGKSMGSLIQQLLLLGVGGDIVKAVPIIGVIFYGTIGNWGRSSIKLSTLFEERKGKRD